MPIPPEPQWKSTIDGLKPDSTPNWTKALADAVDGLVTNQAGLTGITGSVVFTFSKSIFMAQLLLVSATPLTAVAAQAIGVAWGTAMAASIIVVPPGSSLGAPTPPTIWSVCASLIDPSSVAAAQAALIADLTTMQPVKNANDSKLGPAFRKAFVSCTATVTGLNSVPPPAGPVPLLAPLTPFM
jgi:hypothetical protein